MTTRYFIFDCLGNVAGNPKGYRTIKGAKRQANSVRTKAGKQIWEAYHANTAKQESEGKAGVFIDRTLYSIE